MSNEPWNLHISHRGQIYELLLPDDSSMRDLQQRLEELTGVAALNQKLLFKGRKATINAPSLSAAGLKDGARITMLGATQEEVGGLWKEESEHKRRERIMQDRKTKGTVKVRSTGSSAPSTYIFHHLEPLSHLPEPATALSMLRRLSSDPAIQHVMNVHRFSVGLLTELAPHEAPNLLGLNVNAGQAIKLRLRTDRYDGFRNYKEIRRVLCHELTHNIWSDHDDNFKELNSCLNREVLEFELNTHTLGGGGEYQPSSELEAEASVYVLGGSTMAPPANETVEERRRRMLDATMNRLRREEEELELSCGTAPPGSTGATD
ncbi:WLM domain-containing protein [Vararia minispora EC-137]|uniref:WLM domain-containing protein n=1 Tax=Vararia minispora EC-137 TaxID=1314806 RepID=A0ACB8QX35_9AGAM|nr:WLM domain-containing protein [Vararia minispora EC-137]